MNDKANSKRNLVIFETIRPLMVRLGVHSYNLSDPRNEFFKSFGCYYMFVNAFLWMTISSGIFVYKHIADFEQVSEPCLVIFGGFQMGAMFFSLGVSGARVKALHLELQKFVDQISDDDAIFNIYRDIEQKCQKFERIVFFYFWFHPVAYAGSLFYSFYCLYIGNYNTTTWVAIYKLSVPFDNTTIWGWYLVYLISFQISIPYSLVMILLMSYFAGCCYYIIGICNHFEFVISSINFDTKTVQSRCKAIKILSRAVNIHNKLFEIFNMAENVHSGGIFWLLPLNVLFFAISMYNTENTSFDFVGLAFHFICIFSSFCWPLIYSGFASYATHQISLMGDAAYNTNWFNYPPELQKYLILIIARSQENIYFTGIGLMYCTLETFVKLLKTSCSYYILFRSLSEH